MNGLAFAPDLGLITATQEEERSRPAGLWLVRDRAAFLNHSVTCPKTTSWTPLIFFLRFTVMELEIFKEQIWITEPGVQLYSF